MAKINFNLGSAKINGNGNFNGKLQLQKTISISMAKTIFILKIKAISKT
ncbi:hypothetical protein [Flavobacterium panacagri]|nr:hypothetical protein [Flavobacterium panacagri]